MTKIYTVKETAEILKISYRKCLDLINGGELKASKVGKVYRITRKNIIEHIDPVDEDFELDEILEVSFAEYFDFFKSTMADNLETTYLNMRLSSDGKVQIAIPKGYKYAKK